MRDIGRNSNQDVEHNTADDRLSSGEAELSASVKSAAEGIGVQSLARDLGVDLTLVVAVDSLVANGMVNRYGVGRVRHLDVKDLWVQERVKRCSFSIVRVSGDVNPADVATKSLAVDDLRKKV